MGEGKKPRGFAAMSPELRAEISSRGGKSAHAQGRAHEFKRGSKLASDAGRRGGMMARVRNLGGMGPMPMKPQMPEKP